MFYFTLSFPASLDNQDINKWQGGLQEKGHKMFITHDPVTCMQHCTNVALKHERYIVQLEKYQPIFFLSLNGFFWALHSAMFFTDSTCFHVWGTTY